MSKPDSPIYETPNEDKVMSNLQNFFSKMGLKKGDEEKKETTYSNNQLPDDTKDQPEAAGGSFLEELKKLPPAPSAPSAPPFAQTFDDNFDQAPIPPPRDQDSAPKHPFSYERELESEEEDLEADADINEMQLEVLKKMDQDFVAQMGLIEERRKELGSLFHVLEERRSHNIKAKEMHDIRTDLEADRVSKEIFKGAKSQTQSDLENLCKRYARKAVRDLAEEAKHLKRSGHIPAQSAHHNEVLPPTPLPVADDEDKFYDASETTTSQVAAPSDHGAKKKTPSKSTRFKQMDLNSGISSCSSIFESNPVKSLKNKLQTTYDESMNVIKNFQDEISMIIEARESIKDVLKLAEKEAKQIVPNPVEEEAILELLSDLKTLKTQLILRHGFLMKEAEEKKLAPRPALPSFDGSISKYFIFQEEFDSATRHYSDRERLTNYKKSFTGSKADALRDLLIGITSYNEAVKILKQQFATESMIPTLQQQVLNLPNRPTSIAVETSNINKMLNYFNLLRIHDKVNAFADQLIQIARQKLSNENCNILYKTHIDDDKHNVPNSHRIQPFIEFLYEVRRINNMKQIEENQPAVTKPNGKTIVSKAHQVQKGSYKCNICGQNHLTSKCPNLEGKTNHEKRKILMDKKICTTCLGMYSSNHKASCRSTYNANGQTKQKLCNCGSRLNNLICSCRTNNSSSSSAPPDSTPAPIPPPPTVTSA